MALTIGELEAVLGVDDSKLDSGLDRSESKFKTFAKKAAVIGAAAGAALTTAVVGAMNIESGTDKLAAQLGLTAQESERIGGIAGQLYAHAYGGSLEEVNNAVGAVISSIKGMRSASSAEVEAMSAKVLDLATTFEVDVARATQIAGQMITSGIAKDGTEAMDLLVASMQQVPAAVREDLLDAIDEYGPFMESIGVKGEQAMGLLVRGAEKGMFGIDKTGDALKEFTIRATDMSTASKVGFDILGLSQENMTRQLLAGGDTAKGAFDKIITGLRDVRDPAQQSQAALALFGTPLEDLSVSEIPEFLASLSSAQGGLGDVGGAADRMGQTLNDNANTNLTSFGRQAKQAFVNIVGGQVLPIVNEAARFLAAEFGPALKAVGDFLNNPVIPALKSFGGFVARNQTPIKIIVGLIAAVFIPHLIALGIAATVNAVKVVAAWVVMKAQAIAGAAVHSAQIVMMVARWAFMGTMAVVHATRAAGAWLLATGPAAVTAVASMVAAAAMFVARWAFMGLQALLHAAKVALAWLIAMGPIGLVIALVIGLVAVIIANWDTIKKWTVKIFTAVWGFLKGVWDRVVSFIRKAIGFVKDIFVKFHPVGIIIKNWGGIWDFIRNLWNRVLGLVRSIPGRITSALGNVGRMLFNAGKNIIQGLLDGIRSMIQRVRDTISNVAQTVRDFLPFSPAKEGPLSGSGNPFRSGQAIATLVAQGINSGVPAVAAASGGMAAAAREILAAMHSGKTIFEDFSFRGMSANAARFNDQIADRFTGDFNGREFGAFLTRLAAPSHSAPVVRGGDGASAMPEVRVFIGNRELTDIVRVEVRDRDRSLKRRTLAGAGAAR